MSSTVLSRPVAPTEIDQSFIDELEDSSMVEEIKRDQLNS